MQLAEAVRKPKEQLRRQALDGVAKLPPFSAVMNRLMATLANADISFAEVAALIEQDTVLAGNVLKLVNSAAYGRRGTVNSVRHAVSMLGIEKVRNAAMTISVGQMWGRLDLHPQWSPKQFHLHATAAAVFADQLALELPVNYPEGAFTSGLLSGIGLLLTATALRQEYTQLNRVYHLAAVPAANTLEECEEALFGFAHCELSADVMERWALPSPMVDAVRASREPGELPPAQLSGLVQLAIQAAAQSGYPIQSWVRAPAGDTLSLLQSAGLGERAGPIVDAFQSQMDALLPFA
jgi:HD-like signal output (HDOD) protein